MLTRCPYTLKLLSEVAETSREHVILDALGGPNGYSVTACRTANSQLGNTVDAAFLAEPLVEMFRSKVGVESRSGVASWKQSGETVDGNRPVEVIFPHQGPVEVYHRKPVEKVAQGKSYQIIAPPAQADKILKEMKENLAKKGIQITTEETTQSQNQTIKSRLTLNLTVMNAGLMKIAYLACCEFLGDSFLTDPLNPEWQKAIRAQNANDADQVKIHGRAFGKATESANQILPKLAEHEHGIAILNLKPNSVFVVVRLFGCELLTAVACASETSNHGLPERQGMLVICDSKTGVIRRERIEAQQIEENLTGHVRVPESKQ
jgi:hypothetical protein